VSLKYNGASRREDRQSDLRHTYAFDRSIDGYPEKPGYSLSGILDKNRAAVTGVPQLALYKVSARAVNAASGKTSAESAEAAPDVSEYLTWLPSTPVLSGFSAGRTVEISVGPQSFYGAAGAVFQTSKLSPTADPGWHAPLMADTGAVYADEGADRYEPNGQLAQQLPLEGQSSSLPKDTVYKYRARGVAKDASGNILYYSGLSAERAAIAKASGALDIAAGAVKTAQLDDEAVTGAKIAAESVSAEKIKAGSISADRLNVLSKNLINPLLDPAAGKQGWTSGTDAAFELASGDGVANGRQIAKIAGAQDSPRILHSFQTNPDDILEFTASWRTDAAHAARFVADNATGLEVSEWSDGAKAWSAFSGATAYAYTDTVPTQWIGLSFYFVGANVTPDLIPAPKFTQYACFRLPEGTGAVSFDNAEPGVLLLFAPSLRPITGGKITAGQLVAKDAVVGFMRSALLRGADNDHLIALESVPAGAAPGLPETPANTFLLGKPTDPSFFRYEKIGGVWQIALRLAAFIVDGLKSMARGVFQVFRSDQDVGADKPVFEVEPGLAAGSESVTARGAFRVRGSSGGSAANETALFEVVKTAEDGSAGKTRVKDSLQVAGAANSVKIAGDMMQFYQEDRMQAQIKLSAAGLLVSGALTALDGVQMVASDMMIGWTAVVNSTFGGAGVAAIAYGGGMFVAGGGAGKIARRNGVITYKDFMYQVGDYYIQYPDAKTPKERGLPGDWEIWSHRAVIYGLSQNAPPSFADYYGMAGSSIAAKAAPIVCCHKMGGDFRLYKFKARAAAYTVPAELDPLHWTRLASDVIDGRQKCGNPLTADDYEIGAVITSGAYAGLYVNEIIVPGGKFLGVEGGFRPTFVSSGVQDDRMRNIEGNFMTLGQNSDNYGVVRAGSGAFQIGLISDTAGVVAIANSPAKSYSMTSFSSSRVVPTGPDDAPANLSKRLWRRVS
jgi:hypothetical protein